MSIEINSLLMILFVWCTANFVLVVVLLALLHRRIGILEDVLIDISLHKRGKK